MTALSSQQIERITEETNTLVLTHLTPRFNDERIALASVLVKIPQFKQPATASLCIHHIRPEFTTLNLVNMVEFSVYDEGALGFLHWQSTDGDRFAAFHVSGQKAQMNIYNQDGFPTIEFDVEGKQDGDYVVSASVLDIRVCMGCRLMRSMKKCERCAESDITTRYCGKECQRNHWSAHKPQCDAYWALFHQ